MMKEWIDKLANEEALTASETERLDAALAEQDATGLPSMVSSLPRIEAPGTIVEGFEGSLKRRKAFRFASGFGAFAAASLGIFFVLNSSPDTPTPVAEAQPSAESLYDWHQEAVATSVLPGDGANMAAFSTVARDGDNQ